MYTPLKKVLVMLAFVASGSLHAQSTAVNNDKDATYKLAKEYYMKGKYSLAYPLFKRLDSKEETATDGHYTNTQAVESRYYNILCGLKLNDEVAKSKALDFIELAYHQPRVMMLCYHLAEYFFKNKNYVDAIVYYNKATIANLSNTEIAQMKFHKAYSHFTLQQFQEAKPMFNAIRQIPTDSNYIDANYYYGFISFTEKNYKDASTAFAIAEKNAPYTTIVPFYIAEIHYFNNERDKALNYAEAKVKAGGQYYDLQMKQLIGNIYVDKRQFKKALPYLEEYVEKCGKPTRTDLYQLSYCYYEASEWTKCIEGFKQLGGKEDSLAQNSMYLLADAYLKTNQKENARSAFLFCASNSSNAVQQEISAFSYAKLSYELGYLDIALVELQKFIIKHPKGNNTQEAKELLVGVLASTSNHKDALELYENLRMPSENVKKLYPKILYGRSVELINDQQLQQADALLSRLIGVPYNNQQLLFTYFWKGEIAYRSDQYDSAIIYFSSYLVNPTVSGEVNGTNAKYSLGYCYLKKNDYKTAQRYFEQVGSVLTANSTPLQQDAYLRSADCYYMAKQYKPALKIYDDIYSHQLRSADYALFQKASIAGALNKNNEKINLLQGLIKEYPNSKLTPEAAMEIANSYLADEKYNEALPPLQQVLKNEDAKIWWPKALLKTGVSYFNTDKTDEALTNFTTLVKQYPNTQESEEAVEYIREIYISSQRTDAYLTFMRDNGRPVSSAEADSITYRAAFLRYEAKDYENAQKGLMAYTAQYPDGKYAVESNYFLAEINIVAKKPNDALAYYGTVAAKAPNRFAERSMLQCARIYYFNLKDYPNAEKYFTQLKAASTLQDTKLEAMRGLLRCQFKQQKFKEAGDNAKELLAETGLATDDKMIANMILGKGYQADNKLTEASSAYKSVIELGKSEYTAEARYRIAEILFLQDKYDDAENAAFEVIKKDGSYVVWVTKSYLLLGDLYFKKKDYFNAEATYKSVSENSTITELKQEAATKLAMVAEEKGKTNNLSTPQ